MRKVSIAKLHSVIGDRKPGYYEAVMAVARPHSETHIEIEVSEYERIRREYALPQPSGPGTWTKWILSRFRIVATHGCKCNKMAKKMNEMGEVWCLTAGQDEILKTMSKSARERKLTFTPLMGKALIVAACALSVGERLISWLHRGISPKRRANGNQGRDHREAGRSG